MAQPQSLYRLAWSSLQFKRHGGSLLRNGILALLGLAVFLIGWFVADGKMVGLYATGAALLAICGIAFLYELIYLWAIALSVRKGVILNARVYQTSDSRLTNKKGILLSATYHKRPIKLATEAVFFPIDVRLLLGRDVDVLYSGKGQKGIVLPALTLKK